jgi:hypothetical protein
LDKGKCDAKSGEQQLMSWQYRLLVENDSFFPSWFAREEWGAGHMTVFFTASFFFF